MLIQPMSTPASIPSSIVCNCRCDVKAFMGLGLLLLLFLWYVVYRNHRDEATEGDFDDVPEDSIPIWMEHARVDEETEHL